MKYQIIIDCEDLKEVTQPASYLVHGLCSFDSKEKVKVVKNIVNSLIHRNDFKFIANLPTHFREPFLKEYISNNSMGVEFSHYEFTTFVTKLNSFCMLYDDIRGYCIDDYKFAYTDNGSRKKYTACGNKFFNSIEDYVIYNLEMSRSKNWTIQQLDERDILNVHPSKIIEFSKLQIPLAYSIKWFYELSFEEHTCIRLANNISFGEYFKVVAPFNFHSELRIFSFKNYKDDDCLAFKDRYIAEQYFNLGCPQTDQLNYKHRALQKYFNCDYIAFAHKYIELRKLDLNELKNLQFSYYKKSFIGSIYDNILNCVIRSKEDCPNTLHSYPLFYTSNLKKLGL